ncbi:hypothetical protein BB561_000642 [Smittium simulii]|uniref:Uncharacterized protein n=1 Tax=Smittium simulii TaxID=133385 RepID=A0A2T9YYD9_9FUNG|nr:hypothetical protein BB561_000642 [Smittium simulii]
MNVNTVTLCGTRVCREVSKLAIINKKILLKHRLFTTTPNKNANKSDVILLNSFKIKYKLPSQHQGLLDTTTKERVLAKFSDRIRDHKRRSIQNKKNRFEKLSKQEPQLLVLNDKLKKNFFAKMLSSGLRECVYSRMPFPRGVLCYPDPSTNEKIKFALVVDETRQTTRYRGKSLHLFCNANVIVNYIMENKVYIKNILGEIRSDLLGHIEKILKIRILTEVVSLLAPNKDDPKPENFQPFHVYNSTELEALSDLEISNYASIIKFDKLDPNYEKYTNHFDTDFLIKNFLAAGALDLTLMQQIYNELPAIDIDLMHVLTTLKKRNKLKQLFDLNEFIDNSNNTSVRPNTDKNIYQRLSNLTSFYNGTAIFGSHFPSCVFLKIVLMLSPDAIATFQNWLKYCNNTPSQKDDSSDLYICITKDSHTNSIATQFYKLSIYL